MTESEVKNYDWLEYYNKEEDTFDIQASQKKLREIRDTLEDAAELAKHLDRY